MSELLADFSEDTTPTMSVRRAFVSFFVVSALGGLMIGLCSAILAKALSS